MVILLPLEHSLLFQRVEYPCQSKRFKTLHVVQLSVSSWLKLLNLRSEIKIEKKYFMVDSEVIQSMTEKQSYGSNMFVSV